MGKIFYKTAEEIACIRESAWIVSRALSEVSKIIQPGISTATIDKLVETFICDHGALPAFKGYRGFPNACCISVNEEVVHGIPSTLQLREGDIVSVDIGVLKNGFYGDSAYTFAVGPVTSEVKRLLDVTKKALYKGIEQAVPGKRIGDISYAIQDYVERQHGFHVVRDLVGHGIGRQLHEEPQVPNFGKRGQGPLLREGLVIAIEPMVNMGTHKVFQQKDGWTIVTADRSYSAHYEHVIVITAGKPEILTDFSFVEAVQVGVN